MGHYHRLTLMEGEELSRMLAAGIVYERRLKPCSALPARCHVNLLGTAPAQSDLSRCVSPSTGDSVGPSATEPP